VIDKETVNKVQEWLNSHPQEFYWDYRDELSDEQVNLILADKVDEVYDEMWEYNIDTVSDMERGALKEAIEHFDLLPDDPCLTCDEDDCEDCENYLAYDEDELMDNLIEELIGNVDVTINLDLESLVHNTRGKYLALALPVEHDSYWREYADVKDELAYWGINPIDLKPYYPDVRWYNCPTRTAPKMTAKEIVEAWANCFYSGYWYAMLDCRDTLELAMKFKLSGRMVLKKGARVVIHDYFNGASAIDAFTAADIEVEIDDDNYPFNDGANRYGIQSCCAYISEAWESVLEPIKEEPCVS